MGCKRIKTKCILLFALLSASHVFSQAHEIKKYPYNFTINKNKFRIIKHLIEATDTSNSYNSYLVQKFYFGWNLMDTIEGDDNHEYLVMNDVNNDGYLDIVCPEKWDEANVLLYNPVKNTFVNSGDFFLNIDSSTNNRISIKPIDKTNNLYCDYRQGFLNTNYGSFSSLFQIIDYKRKDLARMYIERYYSDSLPSYFIKEVTINQASDKDITDDKLIKMITPVKENDLIKSLSTIYEDEFDFEKYWKTNWQSFLKNK